MSSIRNHSRFAPVIAALVAFGIAVGVLATVQGTTSSFTSSATTSISMQAVDATITHAWTGTAHNSASIETPPTGPVRTNLLVNPSAEAGIFQWGAYRGFEGAVTHSLLSNASSESYYGARVSKMTWTTAPSNLTGGPFYNYAPATFTTGLTYAGGMHVLSSKNQYMRAGYEWYGAGDVRLQTTYGSTVYVPANTWTWVSTSGTAPANATRLAITVYVDPTQGTQWQVGDAVWADAALLEAGVSVNGRYFDGSRPPSIPPQ